MSQGIYIIVLQREAEQASFLFFAAAAAAVQEVNFQTHSVVN